ncbi:MAG: hypothetical protein WCG03_10415 [Kiritimatiellales bacterium]
MKKNIAIISLLLGITTAWAGSITDDFNRTDTAYSTAGATIGANWVSADSSDKFSISGNELLMDTVSAPGILYNNAQQTLSGSGAKFTLSADVAAPATAVWQGIVFNYQNESNYYTLRFKTDTASWQLLSCSTVGGKDKVVKSGNASAAFTAGTLYTLTVASAAAYDFDFTIKTVGGGATLVSGKVVDTNSFFTGGYAGLYSGSQPKTPPDARFDNFSLN